jgi:hypothetical protein
VQIFLSGSGGFSRISSVAGIVAVSKLRQRDAQIMVERVELML